MGYPYIWKHPYGLKDTVFWEHLKMWLTGAQTPSAQANGGIESNARCWFWEQRSVNWVVATQILFIFTLTWGRFPFWLICFKRVGSTTKQVFRCTDLEYLRSHHIPRSSHHSGELEPSIGGWFQICRIRCNPEGKRFLSRCGLPRWPQRLFGLKEFMREVDFACFLVFFDKLQHRRPLMRKMRKVPSAYLEWGLWDGLIDVCWGHLRVMGI